MHLWAEASSTDVYVRIHHQFHLELYHREDTGVTENSYLKTENGYLKEAPLINQQAV
jgi:hypothetical protein